MKEDGKEEARRRVEALSSVPDMGSIGCEQIESPHKTHATDEFEQICLTNRIPARPINILLERDCAKVPCQNDQ